MSILKAPFSLSPRMKTSRYIVISRGTVPTKTDRVFTVTALTLCSTPTSHTPRLVPSSTTVSSRCRLVSLGCLRWRPRDCPGLCRNSPVTSRLPTVNAGSSRFQSRSSPGGITWYHGLSRCRTECPAFEISPGSPRYQTLQYKHEGSPVYIGSSRFATVALSTVLSRFAKFHPGLPRGAKPGQ